MSFQQQPFDAAEFAENPEPRCPCVLLLDVSHSMSGAPIEHLNEGLNRFKHELLSDEMAMKRVEVAIIKYGPLQVVSDFVTPDQLMIPSLVAEGNTPMGAAIMEAISMVDARKKVYKENGIAYYRPWIFMITDGAPTDEWAEAARAIREGEQNKSFMFFSVGVEGAQFTVLDEIATRKPLKLKGLEFGSLFSWLSNSLNAVSQSQVGDEVALQNPSAPDGWATTR